MTKIMRLGLSGLTGISAPFSTVNTGVRSCTFALAFCNCAVSVCRAAYFSSMRFSRFESFSWKRFSTRPELASDILAYSSQAASYSSVARSTRLR